MKFLLILPALLALFVFVEFAKKGLKMENEYVRKMVHTISALVALAFPYFLTVKEIVLVMAVFTIFLIITHSQKWLPGIHQVRRKTWGEIYFPVSVGLLAIIFLPGELKAYQFGVLVMGISDTLAAVVGITWGRHYIPFAKKKSWEGTVTFFVVTLVIFLVLVSLFSISMLAFGIATVFFLAIMELCLFRGLDNLVLPLLAGFLIKTMAG